MIVRLNNLVLQIVFVVCLFSNGLASSADYLPSNILQMDPFFNHHILIAEKASHQLFLFEYNPGGTPLLIKKYPMATGKVRGDKKYQGDHKTPEGVYRFTSFIPRKNLLQKYGKEGEIYGAGAFVMNYPNPHDRLQSKTGGGIWLHSTNDETRIEKGRDSRGCVVVANNDLKDISTFIELEKTSIIIVEKIEYLRKETWIKERKELNDFLETWIRSWREEDINVYLSHYSKEHFKTPTKRNFRSYKRYKSQVFSSPGRPDILLKNVSIFKDKGHARIVFSQHYKSNRINDTGRKTLYVVRNSNYEWEIISERWNKLSENENNILNPLAFKPSMRFFNNLENQ